MAKRRGSISVARRVTYDNANRSRLPRKLLVPLLISNVGQDLRRFNPTTRSKNASQSLFKHRTIHGRHVVPRAVVRNYPRSRNLYNHARNDFRVTYSLPPSAIICAKRKIRREVIFAK